MISYYGGKQRLASKIIQYIPPHTVYVEPFCGGCAVMFKKGLPEIKNSELMPHMWSPSKGFVNRENE